MSKRGNLFFYLLFLLTINFHQIEAKSRTKYVDLDQQSTVSIALPEFAVYGDICWFSDNEILYAVAPDPEFYKADFQDNHLVTKELDKRTMTREKPASYYVVKLDEESAQPIGFEEGEEIAYNYLHKRYNFVDPAGENADLTGDLHDDLSLLGLGSVVGSPEKTFENKFLFNEDEGYRIQVKLKWRSVDSTSSIFTKNIEILRLRLLVFDKEGEEPILHRKFSKFKPGRFKQGNLTHVPVGFINSLFFTSVAGVSAFPRIDVSPDGRYLVAMNCLFDLNKSHIKKQTLTKKLILPRHVSYAISPDWSKIAVLFYDYKETKQARIAIVPLMLPDH